jgi:hypothetical protein
MAMLVLLNLKAGPRLVELDISKHLAQLCESGHDDLVRRHLVLQFLGISEVVNVIHVASRGTATCSVVSSTTETVGGIRPVLQLSSEGTARNCLWSRAPILTLGDVAVKTRVHLDLLLPAGVSNCAGR